MADIPLQKNNHHLPNSASSGSGVSVSRHTSMYKNDALDLEFTRRRSERETVHLRKILKEDCLQQRRARYSSCFRQIMQERDDRLHRERQQSQRSKDLEETAQRKKHLEFLIENLDNEHYSEALHELRLLLSTKSEPPITEALDAGILPKLLHLISKELDWEIQFDLIWILTNLTCGSTESTDFVLSHPVLKNLKTILNNNFALLKGETLTPSVKMESQPISNEANSNLEETIISPVSSESSSPSSSSHLTRCDVVAQVMWTLGNIAGNGYDARQMIVSHGFVPLSKQYFELALLEFEKPNISTSMLHLLLQTVWFISNLSRRLQEEITTPETAQTLPSTPSFFELVTPWLQELLARLLSVAGTEQKQLLSDACWAFMFLSEGSNDRIELVLTTGVTRYLMQLIVHESSMVALPALRVIGNLVTGDDVQTQVVLSAGVLPCLGFLLSTSRAENSRWKMQICWILSNITAGCAPQKQAVIDAGLIPLVLEVMNEGDIRSRREALWVIRNLVTRCTLEQLVYVVQQKACFPSLCHLLAMHDVNTVLLALDCLKDILSANGNVESRKQNAHLWEECGGLGLVEYLQGHQQDEVYKKSHEIIDQFYSGHWSDCDESPDAVDLRKSDGAANSAMDVEADEADGSAQQFHF